MAVPSLSIVIPTHNGMCRLPRCLGAVFTHAPRDAQVIVVDDGSTDGLDRWLMRCQPRAELVRLPANRGYCVAVNAGIAAARGEIVELLNDDTEVQPRWAAAALTHFTDPQVGSVAPLVLRMDDPSVIDSAGQEYHLCGWARDRGHGRRLNANFLQPREVFGPSGSSGFYRRSALARTGGMLPEFNAYLEDVDLAFRLRWAGYRCIYEPASRVLHQGSASYGRRSMRVQQLIARNEELLFWINLSRRQLTKGLALHLGFLLIRGLRQAWNGRLASFVAAKWEAARLWPLICQRRRQRRQLAAAMDTNNALFISDSPSIVAAGFRWLKRGSA